MSRPPLPRSLCLLLLLVMITIVQRTFRVVFEGPHAGGVTTIHKRNLRNWPVPKSFKDVVFPENRKLPILDPVPQWPSGVKPLKYQKRLYDMRGPELVHNTLLYNQYGIIALGGGQLSPDHLQMIRMTINRHLDENKMFAVWRIDPPWKPVTRRGPGKKLGGGKGSISFYVTPIRAGRVILEMGGTCDFEDVLRPLQTVVDRLPFDSMAIDKDTLNQIKQEEDERRARNTNPINLEYALRKNVLNCRQSFSPYDMLWYGKYI